MKTTLCCKMYEEEQGSSIPKAVKHHHWALAQKMGNHNSTSLAVVVLWKKAHERSIFQSESATAAAAVAQKNVLWKRAVYVLQLLENKCILLLKTTDGYVF